MDLKQIKEIVEYAKKAGVQELKIPDLEFKMAPFALMPEPKGKKNAESAHEPAPRKFTDEEMLTWSSTPMGAPI